MDFLKIFKWVILISINPNPFIPPLLGKFCLNLVKI